jgi:hypothetical protein
MHMPRGFALERSSRFVATDSEPFRRLGELRAALAPGTLREIFRAAGITVEEFRAALG